MPALFVALLALAPAPSFGQDPGYVPCNGPLADKPFIGTWLHDAVQTHGELAGTRVWTRMEIRADGEIVEDYFTADPTLGSPTSFARLFSTWTSGDFVDPEPAKGTFAVMRLAPYLTQTYQPSTDSYSSLRGGLLPVFRRFALAGGGEQMTLWGSTVLQLPGSTAVASYPDDLETRAFRRLAAATAVAATSWGRAKAALGH